MKNKIILVIGVNKQNKFAYVTNHKQDEKSYSIYSSGAENLEQFKSEISTHLINLKKEQENENLPLKEAKRIKNRLHKLNKVISSLKDERFKEMPVEGCFFKEKLPKTRASVFYVF